MITYQVFIDGKEYKNAVYPFKFEELLDEQLDNAMLTINRVNVEFFAPTTPVKIVITSDTEKRKKNVRELYYVISNDSYRESPSGSGLFNHTLSLIEPTKLLEGALVETLAFTNAGARKNEGQPVIPNVNPHDYFHSINSGFDYLSETRTPLRTGDKAFLPRLRNILPDDSDGYYTNGGVIYLTNKEVNRKVVGYIDVSGKLKYPNETAIRYNLYIPISQGMNIFTYEFFDWYYGGQFVQMNLIYFGVDNYYPLKEWTIQDVIHRLLELEKPLIWDKENAQYVVPPRYKLSIPEGKERVFSQTAPEFTFSRLNLRECLQLVGSYIHAEPRLIPDKSGEYNTITFDFFGEREYATYHNVNENIKKTFEDYNYKKRVGNYGIEQACTSLDSYMDNLVNKISEGDSTTVQPFAYGGQTIRTESATILTDTESSYIATDYPILSVQKLYLVWKDSNENLKRTDLSPYLYEKQIYDSQLSSYEGVYPIAKAYGIYYTQGEKNIKGLFYKNTNAVNEALGTQIFSTYALLNVIRVATGNQVNIADAALKSITNLKFEIWYTPIYSDRISHSKQYIGDWLPNERVLNYAQSANMVEAQYFGENIKGEVERLGNPEKSIEFAVANVDALPRAGMLWDEDYYISAVAVEVTSYMFNVRVDLSKNFNRMSKYIGVQSYKRIFEVSEVMVTDRHTNYQDYIVISENEKPTTFKQDCLFMDGGVNVFPAIIFAFTQGINSKDSRLLRKISAVKIQGTTKKGDKLTQCVLPVVSSAFGNTMEFLWEYKNNYSAGIKTARPDGTRYFGQDVQYNDYYGRMYYTSFSLGYAHSQNYDLMEQAADEFPQYVDRIENHKIAYSWDFIISTWNNYLITRKDSRETLKMSYSIEFVTDEKNIIVGSGLARYCSLVDGENLADDKVSCFVVLKNPINRFEKKVDLSDGNVLCKITTSNSENYVNAFTLNVSSNNQIYLSNNGYEVKFDETLQGKAWAYVIPEYTERTETVEDEDGNVKEVDIKRGGELLFGKNVEVNNGDKVGEFYMYGIHDIYDYKRQRKEQEKGESV